MARRSISWRAAVVLTGLAMSPSALAQSPMQERSDAASRTMGPSGGFRTDRLTARQLRTWKAIEQIVQAADDAGQPLHPRLHSLWKWAQMSGHRIHIEMVDRKDPAISHAGALTLQRSDSTQYQQVAALRLHLRVIDEASTQKEVRRSDGFIPFLGLGKNERYAQVVGHELAHASLMLEDPEYARLCAELDREKAEFHLSRRQSPSRAYFDQETRQRLLRLQALTDEIEKPAQATEVEIWRELLKGQRAKTVGRGLRQSKSW